MLDCGVSFRLGLAPVLLNPLCGLYLVADSSAALLVGIMDLYVLPSGAYARLHNLM
jgi:hypothetical protein